MKKVNKGDIAWFHYHIEFTDSKTLISLYDKVATNDGTFDKAKNREKITAFTTASFPEFTQKLDELTKNHRVILSTYRTEDPMKRDKPDPNSPDQLVPLYRIYYIDLDVEDTI